MSRAKKFFVIILLTFFIIINSLPLSFATFNEVTDEKLKSTLQGYLEENNTDNDIQILIEKNQIKITSNDESGIINYDLTDKPTFMHEFDVKSGMSYDELKNEYDKSMLVLLGYMAVATIQGVDETDAINYITETENKINVLEKSEYIICKDKNEDNKDYKIIYESEFGDHVMEYVNSIYKDKLIINDADELNTYELTAEKKDETPTSCKIVTTLTVNKEGNFSQIEEYIKNKENEKKSENILINSHNETKNSTNQMANISIMPKTGEYQKPLLKILYIIISIAIIGILGMIITKRKHN